MGQNKKMRLAEITKKYVGAPYKLGSFDPKEGLDCLSLVLNFTRDLSGEVPEEFDGVTIDDYPKLWKEEPIKAKKKFVGFLASTFKEIDRRRSLPGDIIVCTDNNGKFVIGINAGNGQFLTVVENEGVRKLRISDFTLKRVYRCQRQQ